MADIRKLEKELWESADNLRANSKLTSQQYCMPLLGLIFLRYAWGRFKKADADIKQTRSQATGRQIPVENADYTKRGAMFLPEEARYDYLLNLDDSAELGKAVNKAMTAIEQENPQLAGVLPKNYTDLGDDLLRETLRLFNKPELDEDGDDIIGRIYEYFLDKFAPAVASDDGVFFTPKSLVRMIMNIIEPKRGTMLDPACGSGGMFVSASEYVRDHGGNPAESMTFYGQEKVDYNAKLCLMNMAVHGMNGKVRSGDSANTFYHDAWGLDRKCDYVAANPPFNVDKVKSKDALDAGRMPLGISSINKKDEFSNANYLWINYFYSYLKDTGRAGFVMASSATDSANKDRGLRENLVKTGHVDVMLYVGNNFFYTKSLPCTLWFLDKGKPEALQDKVLFIDAQNYHTEVDTTHNQWSDWQIKNLSAIVWLYRGEAEKYNQLLQDYCTAIRKLSILAQGEARDELAKVESPEDFVSVRDKLSSYIETRKSEIKTGAASAKSRERKRIREAGEVEINNLEDALTVINEAMWLTDKFGSGNYTDIPGLCKIASRSDIKEHNWSLTPGAYVGVPPQPDDGVDFHDRMSEIHDELQQLQAEGSELMATIDKNFQELGL